MHEDPLAVEVMVWFLYFGTYPHFEGYGELGIFGDLRFCLHVHVCTLAKKYELPALALLAKKHFATAVEKHWNVFVFLDCIPVIYGTQPQPVSTFRRMVAQRMQLNLEWGAKEKDLWDNFQHHVQTFPLFACDVLSAIYAKPIPEPGLTLKGGLKEPAECHPDEDFVVLDEDGHGYSAALFKTNSRKTGNQYCNMDVTSCTELWSNDLCTTSFERGEVGDPVTARTGSLGESEHGTGACLLDDARGDFKAKFNELTGLDWADRFDQPVRSKYTYLEDGWSSIVSGWDNADSKPLLFDVSRTSTSMGLHRGDPPERTKATESKSKRPLPSPWTFQPGPNPPRLPPRERPPPLAKKERWQSEQVIESR